LADLFELIVGGGANFASKNFGQYFLAWPNSNLGAKIKSKARNLPAVRQIALFIQTGEI
jgi:hypothetical protein